MMVCVRKGSGGQQQAERTAWPWDKGALWTCWRACNQGALVMVSPLALQQAAGPCVCGQRVYLKQCEPFAPLIGA